MTVYSLCQSILTTQEKVVGLTRDLAEAQKVIEKGETLEPVLRQRIVELEDDNKDLKVT